MSKDYPITADNDCETEEFAFDITKPAATHQIDWKKQVWKQKTNQKMRREIRTRAAAVRDGWSINEMAQRRSAARKARASWLLAILDQSTGECRIPCAIAHSGC
jgi:hypothetical protein